MQYSGQKWYCPKMYCMSESPSIMKLKTNILVKSFLCPNYIDISKRPTHLFSQNSKFLLKSTMKFLSIYEKSQGRRAAFTVTHRKCTSPKFFINMQIIFIFLNFDIFKSIILSYPLHHFPITFFFKLIFVLYELTVIFLLWFVAGSIFMARTI